MGGFGNEMIASTLRDKARTIVNRLVSGETVL